MMPSRRSARPAIARFTAAPQVDDPKTGRAITELNDGLADIQLDPRLPRSGAEGDVFYRDASGRMTTLVAGGEGDLLTMQDGIPTWEPASSAGLPNDWGTVP